MAVADVARDDLDCIEDRGVLQVAARAVAAVMHCGPNIVALLHEVLYKVAADEATCTSDQDAHQTLPTRRLK